MSYSQVTCQLNKETPQQAVRFVLLQLVLYRLMVYCQLLEVVRFLMLHRLMVYVGICRNISLIWLENISWTHCICPLTSQPQHDASGIPTYAVTDRFLIAATMLALRTCGRRTELQCGTAAMSITLFSFAYFLL